MTCRYRTWVGSYLLGALLPAERRDVEKHLVGCRECRSELIVLAVLPGLLRRVRR